MKTSSTRSKKLGVWMGTALVIGNMIGSGIFLLPAALSTFGGISILGWILTATGGMLLALIYARLSRIIPKTGGPYTYIRVAFGDFTAFLVAWGYWIALFTGLAAIAVGFVGYFAFFWPELASNSTLAGSVAIFAVWVLTWINMQGIREAGIVQFVTTVLKTVPLLLIGTLGYLYFQVENFTPFNPTGDSSFSAIGAAAALTLWAFLGLESATIPADEMENPEKTVPKATIYGTFITAIIYIISTIAVMGIIPPSSLSTSTAPFADAAEMVWGSWAGYAMAGGAVIACFGALNGWTLVTAQIPLAMAKDGLFPKKFGELSQNGTPDFGLIANAVLVSLTLLLNFSKNLVNQFTFIILLATMTTLLLFALSSVAELMISIKEKKLLSMKGLIKLVTISALAFLYSMWTIAGAGQEIVYWGFLLIITGVPVYIWIKWQDAK